MRSFPKGWGDKWVFCGVWLFSFGFYLKCAAPSVTAGDSGEFMTTAATLSIAHAPSYPLYSLLGRLWLECIPWASPAFRLNIFSAFCSSGALALVYWLVRLLKAEKGPALLLALLVGTGSSFWGNSLVTEVFALNTFLLAWLICLMIQAFQMARAARTVSAARLYVLIAFLMGVGLGNHHILVFFAPLVLVSWLRQFRRDLGMGGVMVFMGIVGFSVYLFLPIRSSKEPPFNWGQPTTLNRLVRTLTRKDYGSFKLSLDKTPPRTLKNTWRQAKRFGRHLNTEIPWFILIFAVFGFVFGIKEDWEIYGLLLFFFVLVGPFFYLLANMPFDAQSEGVMGRFFIVPATVLVLGMAGFLSKHKWVSMTLLGIFIIVSGGRGISEAHAHRQACLVLDYARAMLRTCPPHSTLFMDGGDDAFYSLAALHYVEGRRPDMEFHDRGGLVYHNVYGKDFRTLTPAGKDKRRHRIEKRYFYRGPLFYSTMNSKVFPGGTMKQVGFLLEVQRGSDTRLSWPLLVLRSLHPIEPSDYRTRALGCFFPFMRGLALMEAGKLGDGLRSLKVASQLGYDIGWLKTNLEHEYEQRAFNFLERGQFTDSRRMYETWIAYDGGASKAYSNLGVVLEKMGKRDKAKTVYQTAMRKFPQAADPVFNLAVMEWQKENWPAVITYLKEVLKRDPHHANARRFLAQAKFRQMRSMK